MSDMEVNEYIKLEESEDGEIGDVVCSGCDSRSSGSRFAIPHSEDCPAREIELEEFGKWALEQRVEGHFNNIISTETEIYKNWEGAVNF